MRFQGPTILKQLFKKVINEREDRSLLPDLCISHREANPIPVAPPNASREYLYGTNITL